MQKHLCPCRKRQIKTDITFIISNNKARYSAVSLVYRLSLQWMSTVDQPRKKKIKQIVHTREKEKTNKVNRYTERVTAWFNSRTYYIETC